MGDAGGWKDMGNGGMGEWQFEGCFGVGYGGGAVPKGWFCHRLTGQCSGVLGGAIIVPTFILLIWVLFD